jgi:hypothetical protein
MRDNIYQKKKEKRRESSKCNLTGQDLWENSCKSISLPVDRKYKKG